MSPRVRLTRGIEFSTSLRMRHPKLSDAENERLYGPLGRTHGHNFRLEVTLAGEPDPVTGMVMDLKDVKEILEREIDARFDHRDLVADGPWFEREPATPENFARLLFGLVDAALPPGLLEQVRLHVDADHFVDFARERREA